jgi:hypothetical protein
MAEDKKRREEIWTLATKELRGRLGPLIDDARKRGFVFFSCALDLSLRSMPIRLRFGDGRGAFYERSLGIMKVAHEHGWGPLTLGDAVDFKVHVQAYVRSLDGIKMLGHNMSRRRVRANPKP